MARGLLMLRPSRAMVATTAMAATAVATTAMARGLLMPSLRPRPRLSPDTAITDMAVGMVVMDMAVATTARGLLMLSLRLMLLLRLSPVTAVDTAMAAMAMAATGV